MRTAQRQLIADVFSEKIADSILEAPQIPLYGAPRAVIANIVGFAFAQTREQGHTWHQQAYYLDHEQIVATAVSAGHKDGEHRLYPVWMSMWPFAVSWPEIQSMYLAMDSYVTVIKPEDESPQRMEAMVILEVSPTHTSIAKLRYQVKHGRFYGLESDLTDDLQLEWQDAVDEGGVISDLVVKAQAVRLDHNLPVPAWISMCNLEENDFFTIWSTALMNSVGEVVETRDIWPFPS